MNTSATKKATIKSSGTAGNARELSDADIAKITNKVAGLKGKANVEGSASANSDDLVSAIGELTAGVQAANQKAAALETKNSELAQQLGTAQADLSAAQSASVELATARTELAQSQESLAQLQTELATERKAAKAGLLALEINQLREQARTLVQARQMTPADFSDIFGKDDAESATKIEAMASDESVFSFTKSYVQRLASFAPQTAAAVSGKVSVVEPTLPKFSDEAAANSIGAQAAALVNSQFMRK